MDIYLDPDSDAGKKLAAVAAHFDCAPSNVVLAAVNGLSEAVLAKAYARQRMGQIDAAAKAGDGEADKLRAPFPATKPTKPKTKPAPKPKTPKADTGK